jgi:hypothetical protein
MKSFDSWARELASELSDKPECEGTKVVSVGETIKVTLPPYSKLLESLVKAFPPPVLTGKDWSPAGEIPEPQGKMLDALADIPVITGGMREDSTRYFTLPKPRWDVRPEDLLHIKTCKEIQQERDKVKLSRYAEAYGLTQEQLKGSGAIAESAYNCLGLERDPERFRDCTEYNVGDIVTVSHRDLYEFLEPCQRYQSEWSVQPKSYHHDHFLLKRIK